MYSPLLTERSITAEQAGPGLQLEMPVADLKETS